jgi:hypothetical protein
MTRVESGQGGKTEPKKCGYEKDKLPEKPFFPLKVLPCLPDAISERSSMVECSEPYVKF